MSEEKNSTCGYCRDAVGQVRPAFITRRAPFGGIRACSPLGGPEQDGTEFALVFSKQRRIFNGTTGRDFKYYTKRPIK